MNPEPAEPLTFDNTTPFGDATFLGQVIHSTRIHETPQSTLGSVSALSARGVRIDHEGDATLHVGDRLTLSLFHDGSRLDLPARVGHVVERGFRRFTFGLVFETLSDHQRDALTRLQAVDTQQLQVA